MSGQGVIHRFLRNPNMYSDIYHRVGNRFNPLKNTLTVLQDPMNNRKLHLIGTANSSTLLAYRTKQLMENVEPDVLYVQTNPVWWNHAKEVHVSNQDEFTQISSSFGFPSDFNFFQPGLEMKFALDVAQQQGKPIVFAGTQFDGETLDALKYQTDMYPFQAFWRLRHFMKTQSAWGSQYQDFYAVLHTRGGQTFAESMDRSRVNFMVAVFNRLAPKQKKIIVDQKDQKLFNDLYQLKGNNIVAVVNQWHMQGIQTHWRRATNTEVPDADLSPIADMDIDGIQDSQLINDYLRDYTSKNGKTEPATWQNYLLNYHKEGFQYERTRHTHHDSHEDIANPGEQSHKSH